MTSPRGVEKNKAGSAIDFSPQIETILRFGTLAPSTHNSQPWLFRVKENSVEIYSDPKVQIKEADPRGRDLYISLGCAIENMIIAAKYLGIFKSFSYRIEGLPNLIAEIFLNDLGAKDESYKNIFDTVPKRVNARGIFKSATVPAVIISEVLSVVQKYGGNKLQVHTITEKSGIQKIAKLTAKGLEMAYKNKSFRNEMAQWVRNSLTRKKDGIPGYALKMPFLISFIFPFLMRTFDMGKKLGLLNYISISSAPMILVLSSKGETKEEWLETGRLGERLMLEFQSRGFQTSIFVASVEMGDLYQEVQKLLGTDSIPNFVFALGRLPGKHRHTPRLDLWDKLVY